MPQIDGRTLSVSARTSFEIVLAVERALREAMPELRDDPLFTVTAEPRGTYTGVTIFVQPANVDAVATAAERIENELEAGGIRTLINVRSWS